MFSLRALLLKKSRILDDDTYESHVVEADGGAVHADTEEGHEETHVEPGAGEALEDGAGVGLEGALALRHGVPTRR